MKKQIPLLTYGLLAAFAVQGARADFSSAVLSQNPLGYWPLNDTVTPPVPVLATNLGSVGSAGNAPFLADVALGVPGALPAQPGNTAGGFPGYLDRTRVRVPNHPAWNTNGSFSVEFWAKPGVNTGTSIFCPAASMDFNATAANRAGWLFYQGNNSLTSPNGWYFRIYRAGGGSLNIFANMTLDTNAWYHLVGVYNSTPAQTNTQLYVNGVLVATSANIATPAYAPMTSTTIPMAFGGRSDGLSGYFGYVGSLDEPAFYPYALTPAKVSAHYSAGTNAAPATPYQTLILADNPAGYWRLDAIYGPPAANFGTSATPGVYSGNSQPGVAGPSAPAFPGLAGGNKAVNISSNALGSVRLAPLNVNSNRMTITAWVKPNGAQSAYAGMVFQWANVPALTYSGLTVGKDGGQQFGYTWNDTAASYDFASPLNIPDGKWSFVALSITPDSATLAAGDDVSFNSAVNLAPNAVQGFQGVTHIGMDAFPSSIPGANASVASFNGAIDEVAIFNRSLSLGEIYSLYAAAKGGVAPEIFAQPVAPSGIFEGDGVSLTVDAGGTPDLYYQWQLEGTNLPGATTSAYSRTAAPVDTGSYTVTITNQFGSVTSFPAYLFVSPADPPFITSQAASRTVYENGTINLWVAATGGGLRYRWLKDGTNYPGATSSNLVLTASAATSGTYLAIATNGLGSATSAPIVMTVIVPPAGSYAAVVAGDRPTAWWRLDETPGSFTFYDAVGSNDGLWIAPPTLGVPGVLNGIPNTAASFDLASRQYGEVPYTPALNGDTFTIEAWVRTSDDGNQLCPVSSWRTQPIEERGGYMFIKNDDNTWHFALSRGDNFAYTYLSPPGEYTPGQWQHLALTVSPAGITYYVNGVGTGTYTGTGWIWNNAGPFRIGANAPGASGYDNFFDGTIDEVAYYPRALTASNILAHYQAALFGNNTAPYFTRLPRPQGVAAGATVTFTARAEGTVPLGVQWLKNGTPLPGQTNSTLTLTNVHFTDAGNYQLRATNSVGASNSPAASLSVMPPNPMFANLTNDLILHLKFDGNYSDSSGRGNHGTPAGTNALPVLVAGKLGNALQYRTETTTGVPISDQAGGVVTTNSYVTLGVRPDLQFGTATSFTVAYWVRLPAGSRSGDLPFFCNDIDSLGNPGYTFAPGYTNGSWAMSLGALRIGGAAINDGNWHSLVHSVDRLGVVATYLDGIRVNETSALTVGDLNTGLPTNLGTDGTGLYPEPGTADLDDVGVWRRALTEYEAMAIYSVGQNFGNSFDTYGPVTLTIQRTPTGIELIWPAGTLLQSTNVGGPYLPVPGATAPYYPVTPGAGNMFYRIQL